MKIISTYSVKIRHYNRIFKDTAKAYRAAVDFFIDVALREREAFRGLAPANGGTAAMEAMTHRTARHPKPQYDFDAKFYKFPSYLRRAAIMEAFGDVSSYLSNLKNWEEDGRKGRQPGVPQAGRTFPVLYNGNMFLQGDSPYTARIKIYRGNDWVWLNVSLRKGDADYILHHCGGCAQMSPKLTLRGREWFLDFPFEEERELGDTAIWERRILAVDLDIGNAYACVCSAMDADGTIYGRHFLKLPEETDRLRAAIGRIKKAQQHGASYFPGKWAAARAANTRIAVLAAQFILQAAILYHVDAIVFGHLGYKVRKHSGKGIHLQRARRIQEMVGHKANREGIRVSRVCAWDAGYLAHDGSGRVKRGGYARGSAAGHKNGPICVFQDGKAYHCGLNASYNIGARYFIREILKSLPEKERLGLEAKVPSASRRSTSTLSTLFSLRAALTG